LSQTLTIGAPGRNRHEYLLCQDRWPPQLTTLIMRAFLALALQDQGHP
jgi:hypothetical protein